MHRRGEPEVAQGNHGKIELADWHGAALQVGSINDRWGRSATRGADQEGQDGAPRFGEGMAPEAPRHPRSLAPAADPAGGRESWVYASPLGVGAVLSTVDLALLEAWTVTAGGEVWAFKLRDQCLLLKEDHGMALAISHVKSVSAPAPVLNWVGAELSLTLEAQNMGKLASHQVVGKLNKAAEDVARPDLEVTSTDLGGVQVRGMLDSWLAPPGVQPDLWEKDPNLLPLFEGL